MSVARGIERWCEFDRRVACALNRAATYRAFYVACRIASRLGDGALWYAIILGLPLGLGRGGWKCVMHMLVAGAASLSVYWVTKRSIGRARPYAVCPEIQLCGRVLDQFSFPSGHTLHAVAFSFVLAYYFPVWALVFVPFCALVAVSRVVLGLHYPSDVFAGAAMGTAIGWISVHAF